MAVEVISVADLQGPFGPHQPGDLLVVFSARDNQTPPGIPAAGAGVPEYTLIEQAGYVNGSVGASVVAVYAWATASNHVTGAFSNASRTVGYVLRGADPDNPIGGHTQKGNPGSNPVGAPNVTLVAEDGTSALLHHIIQVAQSSSYPMTWAALPNGFTKRYAQNGVIGIMSASKNSPVTVGTGMTVGCGSVGKVYESMSVEIVAPRPAVEPEPEPQESKMKVLHEGAWTPAVPKAVLQDGAWTPTQKVSVLNAGVWTEVWPLASEPPVEEPLYMYDVTFEYLPDYEVQFHIKKGYVSDDPNWEEIIMLNSTIVGNPGPGGYCSRDPKFKFGDPGATRYVCTFEDRSGVPGDTSTRGVKISVDVYPRATVTATADAPVAADAAADRTALPIKGNKDSGLYHMPDSPYYAQTEAEALFATEAEALAAGFTKYTRKPRA